jgi:hypothetical protein
MEPITDMLMLKLTDLEARKLRDLMNKFHKLGPDLSRVYYKLEHGLKRPAVKRKYREYEPITRMVARMDSDD